LKVTSNVKQNCSPKVINIVKQISSKIVIYY